MNERYNQSCWLADNDPVKLETLDKMPVIEYYALLDKKIADGVAALKRHERMRNGRNGSN